MLLGLSDEQRLFIEKALDGKNILVDACIGSGKTTAIQSLCEEISSSKKILYLTYNKLLKLDAKKRIHLKNATVTNYHGFANFCLSRTGVRVASSDMVQVFLQKKPQIPKYDVLIIDEYQDIESELAQLLERIKSVNPSMQIIAVGDMQQKIYDKTNLDVESFIASFLGNHVTLEFTKCFRLSKEHAARLGRIWNKTIVGVNNNCIVSYMSIDQAVAFLSEQNPKDILCLGSRTGSLATALNMLENDYPERFNKATVYASISDTDSVSNTEPTEKSAIFTTFDSSKGLERKIVVIFDYTESYWKVRSNKPLQRYEILRNIFCVAASRGKEQIIFVDSGEALLSEESLATKSNTVTTFKNMEISEMFDFKYKEDIEGCFNLLKCKKITEFEETIIQVKSKDELIDLSPCIGIFQEAVFFRGYNIDNSIRMTLKISPHKNYLFTSDIKKSSLEKKILFLTAIETGQNRYLEQVQLPFVRPEDSNAIQDRLSSVFKRGEKVQRACALHFSDKRKGDIVFSAMGMADVVKKKTVYELKFVYQLQHEHFLQCASYMIALNLKKGILWNTRDNTAYIITIPDRKRFMDEVTRTITKRSIPKYYQPHRSKVRLFEKEIDLYNKRGPENG